MADEPKPAPAQQIPITIGDEMSRGRYSNMLLVTHSSEDFILDWLLNAPDGTHLTSRLIVSPGHIKRIIKALQENLDNYEKQFGPVREIESSEQQFH